MNQTETMQIVECMLFDFVELYNTVKEDIDSPKASDCIMKLMRDYVDVIDNNIDYFSILGREFADDSQLHILVLSALFFISKDVRILDRVEELLFLSDLPIGISLKIAGQVSSNRFINGYPLSGYSHARKLHLHLLQRLREELNSYEYISYEERNHNLIVLETDALLNDYHAPTKLVLDICRTLKYEMGYDVFLIVDFMQMDRDSMEDYWLFPYITLHDPELDRDFIREYEGIKINGYQQVVGNNIRSINNTIKKVYELKPEFVWHIGGQSVLSDLFARVTTLLSMGCVDGYPVSEAPILLSYIRNDKKRIELTREYLKEHGQQYLDIGISLQYYDSGKEYSARDFGIPEDSFIIAVAGNRLDTEITSEFLGIMETILQREKQVYFVIIGECSKSWSGGVFQGRVVNLGYCEDMYNVLKATHLFLNPRRQGGSGGAACAIASGVPVLTLGECDTAFVGEHFICDRIEKYPDMVSKYCHDQTFYDRQSRYALEKHKSIQASHREECAKVVKFVRDWIGK